MDNLAVGTQIKLKGLKKAAQWNDKQGFIKGPYDLKKGRYPVRLPKWDKEMSVRPVNIVVIESDCSVPSVSSTTTTPTTITSTATTPTKRVQSTTIKDQQLKGFYCKQTCSKIAIGAVTTTTRTTTTRATATRTVTAIATSTTTKITTSTSTAATMIYSDEKTNECIEEKVFPGAESTWTCPKCTFINDNNNNFCEICQNSKPLSTHWTCPSCGMKNERHFQFCDTCGADKPSTQMVQVSQPKQKLQDNRGNKDNLVKKEQFKSKKRRGEMVSEQWMNFRAQLFWQEVREDQMVGVNLEIGMDVSTGKNRARIPNNKNIPSDGVFAREAAKVVSDDTVRKDAVLVTKALLTAATWDRAEDCRHLLSSCYCTKSTTIPALFEASSKGFVDVMEVLLQGGAPVDGCRDGSHGKTALHIACMEGHREAAQLLIRYCTDTNMVFCKDQHGKTPFALAKEADMAGMAKKLMNYTKTHLGQAYHEDKKDKKLSVNKPNS